MSEWKDIFNDFLVWQKGELSNFVNEMNLQSYHNAYRAFKFCIRFTLLCPRNFNKETFDFNGSLTAVDLIEVYKKNLPFFMALEDIQIRDDDWMLMDMTDQQIYLLVKSSDKNHLRRVVGELKNAKDNANKKAGWEGKVFYKVINAGDQEEL